MNYILKYNYDLEDISFTVKFLTGKEYCKFIDHTGLIGTLIYKKEYGEGKI